MSVLAFDVTEFRVAMARRGYRTVGELGRRVGVTPSYARQIAAGLQPSEKLRAAFAEVLGVDVTTLWPGPGRMAA